MAIRYLKIVLVVLVGVQGLLYVAGNIANWSVGIQTVRYVLGMEGHEVYGNHIFPTVTHPALITIAFIIILAGEFLVGALCLIGAWHLWRMREESAGLFNSAKTYAILGTGTAMVVWFGGFIVIGGSLFQMWQTQIGAGSFDDSFVFAVIGGLVLIIVSRPDD